MFRPTFLHSIVCAINKSTPQLYQWQNIYGGSIPNQRNTTSIHSCVSRPAPFTVDGATEIQVPIFCPRRRQWLFPWKSLATMSDRDFPNSCVFRRHISMRILFRSCAWSPDRKWTHPLRDTKRVSGDHAKHGPISAVLTRLNVVLLVTHF